MENEFAETVVSMLVYARSNQHLQFSEARMVNEPDISYSGVTMTGSAQYVKVMHDMGLLLDANGMSDVRFSGPDLAETTTSWMSAMMADPYLMSKVAHIGVHSYQNETPDASGVYSFIQQSPYPATHFWMTEYNVWCESCYDSAGGNNTWAFARGTASYLLNLLAEGASAGIVFEGYDSQYYGYNTTTGDNAALTWSFWGLFAVDNTNATPRTYTPRKGFHTLAQIALYVRPGAQRINVGNPPSGLTVLAFYNPGSGQFTITGVNANSSATPLSCGLTSLPSIPSLDMYYTSSSVNLSHSGQVAVNNGVFSVVVPADCVFTLTYSNSVTPLAVSRPAVAVAAPYFLTPVVQNGSVSLTLSTAPGFTYQIEASSNLVDWVTVTNIAGTNGTIQFIDVNAAGFSRRFYRAVSAN